MTNTVAVGSFYPKRGYPDYVEDVDKPLSYRQRKTLEELIFSRVSNPDEIQRRLSQIEGYNFDDGQEMIKDLLFAPLG